jgi:xanthine/uracil permease
MEDVKKEKEGVAPGKVPDKGEEAVFETVPKTIVKPIYRIEERPKTWWETIIYGWQTTIVDFTPFIWATALVSVAGAPRELIPPMISACFLAMFIATILQTTIGSRLPIVQGPSAVIVFAMGGVAKTFGLPAMWGAAFVAALIEFFIGASRILGYLRKMLPMTLLGIIITTIGIMVSGVAIIWIFGKGNIMSIFLGFMTVLVAVFLKFRCAALFGGLFEKGFVLFSVLIVGVGIGSITGSMDWSLVAKAKWFGFPKIFPFGGPGFGWTFPIGAIVGVFVAYIASMAESIGDYAATCALADEKYVVRHMNRGIMSEGLGCAIAPFFGAIPMTSYSQNIGVIAATRVASRFVIQVAAIFFLLYALCPKLAALLAAIPRGATGGCLIVIASLITAQGINLMTAEPIDTRKAVIIGTTLGLAIGLPVYARYSMPQFTNALHPFLKMALTNSLFIAVIWGFFSTWVIEVLLGDKKKENG